MRPASPANLDSTDAASLLRAITELSEASSLDGLRHRVVEVLPRLVATTMIAWNEVDPLTGAVEGISEPPLPAGRAEELTAAFAANVTDHPVIEFFRRSGDGRPMAISDFLSVEQFHATGIYREVYSVLGAEDQISFTLPDPSLIVGIAMNRAERGFSTRDRSMLNLVRPHLLLAYRSAQAFDALSARVRRLESLEREGEGTVFLSAGGRVEDATPGARRLLASWFPGGDPSEALSSLIDDSRSPAAPAWPVVIERDGRRLVARRLPAPEREGIVVVLSEASPRDASAVLGRLGLSAREAEVLALVADGSSNAKVAATLGISVRTVAKHLEHAFDKLGVENRTSATNLLRQIR